MNVPAELKPLSQFIQRAKEIKGKHPAVSYYCSTYALKKGIELRAQSPESRSFLAELMDKVEKERSQLKDSIEITSEQEGKNLVLKVANDVFTHADNQDKAGKWTKATAIAFLAASQYYEVLNYFGEIQDEEVLQKIKYARFKAADINVAIKTGRMPDIQADQKVEYIPPDPSAPVVIPGEISTIPSLSPQTFDNQYNQFNNTINSAPTSTNYSSPLPPSTNFLPNSFSSTPDPEHSKDNFSYGQNFNSGHYPSHHNVEPQFSSPNPSAPQSYYPVNANPHLSYSHSQQPPPSNHINIPPQSYPQSTPGPPPSVIQKASKHARHAISALQFDDVPTALSNLQAAMNELLPYQNH